MHSWAQEKYLMEMEALMSMPRNIAPMPRPVPSMAINNYMPGHMPGPRLYPAHTIMPRHIPFEHCHYREAAEDNNYDCYTPPTSTEDMQEKKEHRHRDRSRHPRSRDHDRSDREQSNRGDRHRREKIKWETKTHSQSRAETTNMDSDPVMGQSPIEMTNRPNSTLQMPQVHVPQMSNMPMMPQVTVPPGMTDQNMMMNQPLPNQPIFVTNAVLMPPIPGIALPSVREKPVGCRTIFVGGLPHGIDNILVDEIFQRFGLIDDIKMYNQSFCHIRFQKEESVELSFMLSGYRLKFHDQMENEATTILIDYALNRDDENEYERNKHFRETTPPSITLYTPSNLVEISNQIKCDSKFPGAAPTLLCWLERGECNKKNANTFYSLIQASNNQIRRLFQVKMQIDEKFQHLKSEMKDQYAVVFRQ